TDLRLSKPFASKGNQLSHKQQRSHLAAFVFSSLLRSQNCWQVQRLLQHKAAAAPYQHQHHNRERANHQRSEPLFDALRDLRGEEADHQQHAERDQKMFAVQRHGVILEFAHWQQE
ncbi:hypothetical protein ACE1BH_05870, partial [Aeromonas jandaei]